jgi:hypothetical protein
MTAGAASCIWNAAPAELKSAVCVNHGIQLPRCLLRSEEVAPGSEHTPAADIPS